MLFNADCVCSEELNFYLGESGGSGLCRVAGLEESKAASEQMIAHSGEPVAYGN
jgi:hypothetical protein